MLSSPQVSNKESNPIQWCWVLCQEPYYVGVPSKPSTESGSVPALPFQAWVHWCGEEDHPDPSSSLFGRLLERGGYEYPPDVAGELVGRAHWDVHGAWLVLTIFAWLQFLMVTVTVLANLYWIPVSIVFEKLNHFILENKLILIHWCFNGECHGPISLSMASQLSWSSGTCCKPQLRTLRSLNKWFRTMIISYLVYTSMCRYAHCISELGSVRCLVGTPISRIVVKMFQICPVEICQLCNTDTGYLHVAVIIAIIWIHRFFFF